MPLFKTYLGLSENMIFLRNTKFVLFPVISSYVLAAFPCYDDIECANIYIHTYLDIEKALKKRKIYICEDFPH